MTRYGTSPWIDRYPRSRVPSYPRHRGQRQSDVVVIGGGLTGCAVAYAFAAHGIEVTLLEADRIGCGSSGSAAGWIGEDPGAPFLDLARARGVREARHAWQAWRRAALDFAALIRRLDLRCHLEARDTMVVARTPEETVRLKREQTARRDAGLDVALVAARAASAAVGLPAAAALRTHEGAVVDPYRLTLGLAAAAAERGAAICERTPATKITFTRRIADVHTADGALRTRRVIMATGVPTPLCKSLARHFWYRSAYLALTDPIPAKIRHQLGGQAAVLRDLAIPPHVVRWVDGNRLLVGGAARELAPPRQREAIRVQRTGQLMYELSILYPDISGIQPAYGWDAVYGRTADGLPYIGPHRNYPHHLFAWGDASQSMTSAYLASRILLRQHLGEPDAADDVFAFMR